MAFRFASLVPLARLTGTVLVLGSIQYGCQCGSRSSRGSGGTPQVSQPAPAPEPGPAPAPAPAPAPSPDPSVGEKIPPIEPDKVTVVDTSNGGGLKHLIFKSSTKQEYGRYSSEYLMVIKASKPSCIRIKVRPTASVADKIADEIAQAFESGAGPCAGVSVNGEQVPRPSTPAPPASPGSPAAPASPGPAPAPSPASPLHLVSSDPSRLAIAEELHKADSYEFIDPSDRSTMLLTTASLNKCASRIFRMETNPSQSELQIEKFVTKTGRLVSIGTKVRIWVDDEYSNVCSQGGSFDTTSKIAFGPLIQEEIVPADVASTPTLFADKTWQSQLDLLASEMDRVVTRMTTGIGSLSDVDQSGFVEIFLTPEVNRTKLVGQKRIDVDNFRASPIFKPQDLAYFNAEKNPTSNEGEVLYLWVPDPAGIYTAGEFPSSNSLTTNYAKGYLSTQLSGLIYINEKILKQKQKSVDDRWLIQALSLVASMYYAGIDYSTFFFSQYLTSRPQYITLSKDIDTSIFSAQYLPFAFDEQLGMRGLFGWYLHNTVCGTDVLIPCDAMRKFYTSAKSGAALVEEVLGGTSYDNAVKTFGLSLAIGLADNRESIYKLWDSNAAGYPPRPVVFRDLTEIFPAEPPVTEEEDNKAVLLQTSKIDRTVAGPYPSRKMLFAQPLAPDYDLEFKLVPDSIAVVQPMGFVSETSDAAVILGDGLNVVFVPIGERDSSLRSVHFEKLSERAPGDLRPVNLSNKNDAFTTYSGMPYYQSDTPTPNPNQFTVTKMREVWSFGSLDNFYINQEGSKTKVSDTDSVNIEFQPCSGITSSTELTSCQAKSHKAIVQLVIRDLDQELAPMLLVTTPDRKIFRGHSILDRLSNIDTAFEDKEGEVSVLCEASHATNSVPDPATNPLGDIIVMPITYIPASSTIQTSIPHALVVGNKVYFTSADGNTPPGVSPFYAYTVSAVVSSTVVKVSNGSNQLNFLAPTTGATQFMHRVEQITTCANGGLKGAPFFSDLHSRPTNLPQPPSATTPETGFKHNYVNYLIQGVLGYPYSTRRTVSYSDQPDCPGAFCYLEYEADRQFLKIALDKEKSPTKYVYYPGNVDYDRTLPLEIMSSELINQAAGLKKTMDDPQCSSPLGQTSIELCMTLSGLDENECKNACAVSGKHKNVDAAIASNFANASYFGVCTIGPGCQSLSSLMAEGYPPNPNSTADRTSRWLRPNRFLMFGAPDTSATFTTHYVPVEPQRSNSYCLGFPDVQDPKFSRCSIKEDSVKAISDIREQLHVPENRFSSKCFDKKLSTDMDVCIDRLSETRELMPESPYDFEWAGLALPSDRAVLRRSGITDRAGEILSKPERLHSVVVEVPGTGTVVNILVGGRKQTQGKYMIRSRLVDWK